MMNKIPVLATLLSLFISVPVLADHNSPWGAGWARMPNDVHNTRIDTRGDNQAFRDFVRQGNGASTVNRYSDNVSTPRQLGGYQSSFGGRVRGVRR